MSDALAASYFLLPLSLMLTAAMVTHLAVLAEMFAVFLAKVAFLLGLSGLGLVADGLTRVSSEPVSYLIVGALLYYLMAPHPAAFSKPRLNFAALGKTDWKTVDWEGLVKPMKTGKRYAIIGAGFVGKRLIHALLLRGETHIVAFDMDPTACEMFKGDARVKFIRGDVTKYEQVRDAIQGAEVVITTFAIIRFMDRFAHQAALSYNINVGGTENVVRACQECRVQVLVQTSTSNVSVNALQSTLDMDEKTEYVTRENSLNHYGWTKALAEQTVLKADGVAGVRTAAVRPCSGVFGAEDRNLLDGMLKLGRALLPPNAGANVIDFIPVMNVVYGQLLLEKALLERPEEVGGEAFCVSNNAPMRMVDFCHLVGYFRKDGLTIIPTPYRLLYLVAQCVDVALLAGFKVNGMLGQLTGATVEFLELSYAFSSRKAHEKLGYKPVYTVEQAIQMAVDEFEEGTMMPALSH